MQMRPITADPSQIMVEQLAASGVKYVFYNSGSREAHFFDALSAHPAVHGILALHEGSVVAFGAAAAVLRPETLAEFYGVRVSVHHEPDGTVVVIPRRDDLAG